MLGKLGMVCLNLHTSLMPELDFSQYEGREQAYVKHCLLEKYLPEWAYKTGSQWDGLVYIDGFAGPWGVRSEDLADSSFGVAVKALDRVARTLNEHRGKSIQVQCVLVEQNESALSQLREDKKAEAQALIFSLLSSLSAKRKEGRKTIRFLPSCFPDSSGLREHLTSP